MNEKKTDSAALASLCGVLSNYDGDYPVRYSICEGSRIRIAQREPTADTERQKEHQLKIKLGANESARQRQEAKTKKNQI